MAGEISTKLSASRNCITVAVDLTDTPTVIRQTQLGAYVTLEGWPADPDADPELPTKTLWIALPEGMRAAGVRARVISTRTLTDRPVTLGPSEAPHPDSPFAFSIRTGPWRGTRAAKLPPLAHLLRTRTLGSSPVALVAASPVMQQPDRSLSLATRFEITIPLKNETTLTTRKTLSRAQLRRGLDVAAATVINPDGLKRPPVLTLDTSGSNGGPGGGPTAEAAYVIVTDDLTWNATTMQPIAAIPQGLTAAFANLCAWKTSLGLTARVVTVSEIVASTATSGFLADFKTGAADLQQVIRRFVEWAQSAWGTTFVLLGGDQSVVPIRQLKLGDYDSGTNLMPTDMYYSALDPAFDLAESAKPNIASLGPTTLELSVSVGRAPVKTKSEADVFVSKVIAYERAPLDPAGPDWISRLLLAGATVQGDIGVRFPPASSPTDGPTHYYHIPGAAYTLLQLMDLVKVVPDTDPSHMGPAENCFKKVQGQTYYKIHLEQGIYRIPENIDVVTGQGAILTLPHTTDAKTTGCGWFYTDWQNNDGPCFNKDSVNYGTTWIIAYVTSGFDPQRLDVHLTGPLLTAYNVLSYISPGVYAAIPWDPSAGATRHGWYYARSASDLTAMPLASATGQTPSSWIAIFASAADLAPKEFILDPMEESDTIGNLEAARKTAAIDLPQWSQVSRLYPDLVDLPAADKTGDIDYYNQDRLRAKLNDGQHFVYASSHGDPVEVLSYGDGGTFNEPLADALMNGPRFGIGYSDACTSGRYTLDSLGRHLVEQNPAGGFAAYVGFTDLGWTAMSRPLVQSFLHGMATARRLGPALDARIALLEPGSGVSRDEDTYRCIVGQTLLGDPAMAIHGTIVEPSATVGLSELFASEATALARLGGYTSSDRNGVDAPAQRQWTIGKTPEAIVADLKDRYSLQFKRQLGLGVSAAASFYADSMARLATYGLAASVTLDPQPRDPNRDSHLAWAAALLPLPGGAGSALILNELVSRADDACDALYIRPRRFLEMLYVSESVAIDRLSGPVTTTRVDGRAARACATRLTELRDELLADAKTAIENASGTSRADYYAAACLRLNSFGEDFGTASANSLDLNFHRSWALTAAVPNLKEKLVGRIRRIFDQLGCGEPPAAEVRIVTTQAGQTTETVGSSIDFGAPIAGQSVTRKVRIYDVGDGEFLVTSPLLLGGFNATDTRVELHNPLVTVMGSCEVEITFTPSGSTPLTGSLRLDTTVAATPSLTISLRAAPLAPVVKFEPMGLDFGPAKIGVPARQALVLRNSGTCDASQLELATSWVQGPQTTEFELLGAPPARGGLAAGASASFQVQFTPTQPVIIQNGLTATYRSEADPAAAARSCGIMLSGWGIAPTIAAPANLDFGPVPPAQATVKSLFLRNTGQADLVLSSVSVLGGLPSSFYLVAPDGSTAPALSGPLPPVSPGDNRAINVSVSFPKPNAQLSDKLCIASDDPAHPQLLIPLMAVTKGQAGRVRPETIRFGTDPQSPNDVADITIHSTGTDNLSLFAIAIAGVPVATDGKTPVRPQDKLDFVAEGLPSTLTPLPGGSSLAFKVRFRPLGSGQKQATLTVDTSAGKLNAVVMTGTKS